MKERDEEAERGTLQSHGDLPVEEPLVTFLVPCFNSAAYMSTCIDSLILVGNQCEIIIVNDGSSDSTIDIAREYERRFPGVVRVIDQPNSGWGGGVNRGIAAARGVFFKVVDSDDRLSHEPLMRVLEVMEAHRVPESGLDLVLSNFVYDHAADGKHHVIKYENLMPAGRLFEWDEMRRPRVDQYIMIHATWYRTSVLRQSGLVLPEGVFYMDGYFTLHPLPYVRKLYYVDAHVYNYLIGREGQSINMDTVKAHIDQQIMATRMAIDDYDLLDLAEKNPQMAALMARYVSAMMCVTMLYLFMIDTPEAFAKNDMVWSYLEQRNPELYRRVRRSLAGMANRKSALSRRIAIGFYTLARKMFKFA